MSEKVIIVTLRQRPKSNDDRRSDPFYEFGSFGCTGCHDDHLLNKKNQEHLQGVRLAFAQGGKGKIKLVYLTPPIKTRPCGDHLEAYWKNESPFRFSAAPTLVDNEGGTDFPSLCKIYKQHNRTTLLGKFSSEIRNERPPTGIYVVRNVVFLNRASKNEVVEQFPTENLQKAIIGTSTY